MTDFLTPDEAARLEEMEKRAGYQQGRTSLYIDVEADNAYTDAARDAVPKLLAERKAHRALICAVMVELVAAQADVALVGKTYGPEQVLAAAKRLRAELRDKGRMFPLQAHGKPGPPRIPWSVAEQAYAVYARKFGRDQSLERLAERAGFAWSEMDELLPGWREQVSENAALRAENAALRAEVERLRQDVSFLRPDR